jgi:peptide/nickel transport system permease protein
VSIRPSRARALGAVVRSSTAARVAVSLCLLIVLVALVGPFFAPYSPTELVGRPLTGPSRDFPLGTDFLGRDGLSRVLAGGRSIFGLALVATVLAYSIGLVIGLTAGYARSLVDPVLMRGMDVLLAFPPLLFLLVLVTGAGTSSWAVVVGVAVIQVPGIARIIRAATLDVSVRGYVEAAVARGDPTRLILRREILPNIANTVVADGGPRLTVAILLIAGLNFLGLGLQPPAADWALMITENRVGITLQPWVVIAPAVLIALLTIGVNLGADAVGRSLGTSRGTRVAR